MPWKIGKLVAGKGWQILKTDTGEVVGHSKSKEMAMASVRARYSNMPMGEVAHKRAAEKHVSH